MINVGIEKQNYSFKIQLSSTLIEFSIIIPVRPTTLTKCILSVKLTMYDAWVAGGWFEGVVGSGLCLFVTTGGAIFPAQWLVAIGGLPSLFLVYQCNKS